jgi:hypothetical protein
LRRTPLQRTPPPGGVQHNPRQHKWDSVPEAINLFSNISCSTASIDSLTVHQPYRRIQIRPQIHVLLQSAPGSLKSTVLEEIASRHGVSPYSYVTYAAMIGSIDPMTADLIPGLVWQTRRKPLLLDEFRTGERGDTGSIDVLLGTLETGLYKRKVSQRTEVLSEEDGDLYYRVKDGEIEVKTRFSCIIATMKNLDKARSEKYRALVQRCIPIRFALQPEDLDNILNGKTFYHYHKYDAPNNPVIARAQYKQILRVAKDVRTRFPTFHSEYARAVGDTCRITAVLGYVDCDLLHLVCWVKAGLSLDQALQKTRKA